MCYLGVSFSGQKDDLKKQREYISQFMLNRGCSIDDWFEQFCKNHGSEVLVINNDKLLPQQEMIQDLITIIHVFSCKVYGLRSYKKKVEEYKTLTEV